MSTDTMTMESFEYADLNAIDPSQQTLPTDMYTLKILKAEMINGTNKATGAPYSCVSFTFGVTDHPDYSGRRLWERVFPGNFGLKTMRRIMDATGVTQVPGTPITEWLQALCVEQPCIKVQVKQEQDLDWKTKEPRSLDFEGKPALKNSLNLFQILPA